MTGARWRFVACLGLAALAGACAPAAAASPRADAKAKPKLPPEPSVTFTQKNAKPGQRIEHGEWILEPTEAKRKLHAQHHPNKVLETRRVPDIFQKPSMTSVKDFAKAKKDLP